MRSTATFCLLTSLFLICASLNSAEATTGPFAFLAAATAPDDLGPHDAAAWAAAQALGATALLLPADNGAFRDETGATRALDEFNLVWHHQGDAIAYTVLSQGAYPAALKQFAASGRGLLLSGAGLALVDYLGLEPHVRSQRRERGPFRDPAFLVPVETRHPVFVGLTLEQGAVGISNGGCNAVADFYWGGPGEGMLLANTPDGVQRPLVEYAVGDGRIILFGWRWPDYADQDNPYRDNLMRLTANLTAYLNAPEQWQPVVIRSKYPPAATPDEPGVSNARFEALRLAIEDLRATFPQAYAGGDAWRADLDALQQEQAQLPADATREQFAAIAARFDSLQRAALLANPLLDFDRLLVIRRRADQLGLPMNYHGNDDLPHAGYDNALVALNPRAPEQGVNTIYAPPDSRFIGDFDLHFDAGKGLLSMPDEQGRWNIAELDLAAGTVAMLPLIKDADVNNYDACYLPDDGIIFTSTAPFIGVPCVGGTSKVANLYLRQPDGRIRRLTNDQDHNWCPTLLNNGRILYQRWEYADIAHAFTRLLFHMNPDGSNQMEYYGSNSFWPTAMFYARPIPNHPTQVAAIIGGHHDAPRQGELIILDPALGRHETSGVVQRIPGRGETVQPVILDGLISASWPRFLHPWPLSESYFLAACKPTHDALWGIYLVDRFDNFTLLHEEPGWAMLEPVPWKKHPRPPRIPQIADFQKTEAAVQLMDVYRGPGLADVPRGTVKALRIIGYDFTFHGLGAEPDRVGLDGPWDVKRILGTVPVEDDGSAHFKIPALTPVAVQPLDADGKALALMRSWMTAAPGELLSCVGCHESQNTTGFTERTPSAFRRAPDAIAPWYGPARGFSFEREVQPVLNAWCVACHHGKPLADGTTTFDLTARPAERVPSAFQMHFSPAYMELRRWVYTPTLESDAHLLPPRDYHADNSRLVQLLRDGHYGVELNREAWDRLIAWIDLNAPYHGTWKEVVAANPTKCDAAAHGAQRRRELHAQYAGMDEDPEAVHPAAVLSGPPAPPDLAGFHAYALDTATATESAPVPAPDAADLLQLEIAPAVSIELVRIQPGAFIMGSDQGYPNERPAHPRTIDAPFYMARCEITNEQYRCFNPDHDSGLETGEAYQFGDDERGFTLNRPEQPAVRVSWDDAMAFCAFLSQRTGRNATLPTEAQWEYACRAGTNTALWYGSLDADFSTCANLSDAAHHAVYYPHVPTALPPWRPADTRFDDGWRVAAAVAQFSPNPWRLHDMHGNVAEWTRDCYAPYVTTDSQQTANALPSQEAHTAYRVVRGGSWMDKPNRARTAFRTRYNASQRMHDVGFRIIIQE